MIVLALEISDRGAPSIIFYERDSGDVLLRSWYYPDVKTAQAIIDQIYTDILDGSVLLSGPATDS